MTMSTDDYQPGTAEAALIEFARLWKQRKWSDLEKQCQITWAKQYLDQSAGLLRLQFGGTRLIGFKLGAAVPISAVTQDIPITIDYKVGKNVAHKTLLARVICESAPFTPDMNGTWGVNPTSLYREA